MSRTEKSPGGAPRGDETRRVSAGAPARRAMVLRCLAGLHGAYYAVTGLWPIVHLPSFIAVTGPKSDLWLVQFFGALVCVPGLVLAHAAATGRAPASTWLVAFSSAAILGVGDIVFVLGGAIGPIYLLDAAAQLLLLAGWVFLGWRQRSG